MNNHSSYTPLCKLRLLALSVLIVLAILHNTTRGQSEQNTEAIIEWLSHKYDNPSIIRRELDALIVKHGGGIKRIPFSEIPTNLQQSSQDIIFTDINIHLEIIFTNASATLREKILVGANNTINVIDGRVQEINRYFAYTGTVVDIISPNHYLINSDIVIYTTNHFTLGNSIHGLAKLDGKSAKVATIRRFKSLLIPFRSAVAQSDDDGNCFIDNMKIYLVRPPPLNYEVLDGTILNGYAVDEGMYKYVDTLGAVRRIHKWRMLTVEEIERETEAVSQETLYNRYVHLNYRQLTEDELIEYLEKVQSLNISARLKHPCKTCDSRGTITSTRDYETVQVSCQRCGGTGRIAHSTQQNTSGERKTTFGTVQGVNTVRYTNCSSCNGSGRSQGRRLRQVPCSSCSGEGSVEIQRNITIKF